MEAFTQLFEEKLEELDKLKAKRAKSEIIYLDSLRREELMQRKYDEIRLEQQELLCLNHEKTVILRQLEDDCASTRKGVEILEKTLYANINVASLKDQFKRQWMLISKEKYEEILVKVKTNKEKLENLLQQLETNLKLLQSQTKELKKIRSRKRKDKVRSYEAPSPNEFQVITSEDAFYSINSRSTTNASNRDTCSSGDRAKGCSENPIPIHPTLNTLQRTKSQEFLYLDDE